MLQRESELEQPGLEEARPAAATGCSSVFDVPCRIAQDPLLQRKKKHASMSFLEFEMFEMLSKSNHTFRIR
jgi:hypothetical protein